MLNDIPPMTDPLSRHWDQPADIREALMDDKHVILTQAQLDKLPEYSRSIPSGTYSGKCWKRINPGPRAPGDPPSQPTPSSTWLVWYGAIVGDDILIHRREVLILA